MPGNPGNLDPLGPHAVVQLPDITGDTYATQEAFASAIRINKLMTGADIKQKHLDKLFRIGQQVEKLKNDVRPPHNKVGKHLVTIAAHEYNYTIGWVLRETTNPEFLKWKVERYEVLVRSAQQLFRPVIEKTENLSTGICSLDWKLLSKFCEQRLRIDQERLTPEYLEEMRKLYTEGMLNELRKMVTIVRETSREDDEAKLVYELCYKLYVDVDINQSCKEIVDGFVRVGKKEQEASSIWKWFSRSLSSQEKSEEKE